jgi:hypothetical protein
MAIVLDDQEPVQNTDLSVDGSAQMESDSPVGPSTIDTQKLDASDLGELDIAPPVASTTADIGVSGVGPIADGQQYAESLNPGYYTKEFKQEAAEPYGIATGVRAIAEANIPVIDEATAGLFAMMRDNPDLSYRQWMDILSKREAQYRKDFPIAAPAMDIGVGIGAGLGLGRLAGMGAKAGLATAMGANAAMGLGVPKSQMTDPQYPKEAAQSVVLGGVSPLVGAGAATILNTTGRGISNVIGKRQLNGIIKNTKDPETRAILNQWVDEPHRYDIFDEKNFSTVDARTNAYNSMVSALDDINELYSKGKIDEKETEKIIDGVKTQFNDYVSAINRRGEKLAIPPSGTADEVTKHIKNMKQYVNGTYDRYWQNVPQTFDYVADPVNNGIPLSSMIDSAQSAMKKVLKRPDIREDQKMVQGAVYGQLDKWVDNIITNSGRYSDPATIDFILKNKHIVTNPSLRQNLPPAVTSTLRYIDNVDPQEVKEYARALFSGSSGFKDMNDQASLALSSPLGKEVNKQWYMDWANQFTAQPSMAPAKKIHDFAYKVNTQYLKPLEDKFVLRNANKQGITDTLVSAATNTEDQIRNSLRAASLYGNSRDKNLVELSDKIAEAVRLKSEMSGLSFDDAVRRMIKAKQLGVEAMNVLGGLDPTIRQQYRALEETAMDAVNHQDALKKIILDTENFYRENKKVIGKSPETVSNWLSTMSSGRFSKLNRQNMDTSTADEGIEHLNNWYFKNDPESANAALEQLRMLREIDVLNKTTIRGSRETNIARATGEMAGKAARVGFGAMGVPRVGQAIDSVAGQIAVKLDDISKNYVNGKWTHLQPVLIEKLVKGRAHQIDMSLGSGLVSGVITRSIQNQVNSKKLRIEPNTPDGADVVAAIKSDPTLNPQEKLFAIKKFNKEGIELTMPNI